MLPYSNKVALASNVASMTVSQVTPQNLRNVFAKLGSAISGSAILTITRAGVTWTIDSQTLSSADTYTFAPTADYPLLCSDVVTLTFGVTATGSVLIVACPL